MAGLKSISVSSVSLIGMSLAASFEYGSRICRDFDYFCRKFFSFFEMQAADRYKDVQPDILVRFRSASAGSGGKTELQYRKISAGNLKMDRSVRILILLPMSLSLTAGSFIYAGSRVLRFTEVGEYCLRNGKRCEIILI